MVDLLDPGPYTSSSDHNVPTIVHSEMRDCESRGVLGQDDKRQRDSLIECPKPKSIEIRGLYFCFPLLGCFVVFSSLTDTHSHLSRYTKFSYTHRIDGSNYSETMLRGGYVCKEVPNSQSAIKSFDPLTEFEEVHSMETDSTPCGDHRRVPSTNSMQELLMCTVCAFSMYPPIHQCPNGHTLCSNCKQRVQNRCPTCRNDLGNIRCLALERLALSLNLQCRYREFGCQEIFPYFDRPEHEKSCHFRPYDCPYAGEECLISGDIPTLVAHLKHDHKVDMHNGCTFNHRYVKPNPQDVENATWMLTVFNCFGRQFCLHFEAFQIGNSPIYMAFLRFMGSEDEAKDFRYSLEVGGNGRKLTWQGIPRSIRDSHRRVRDSQDGLLIQRNLALFFSGGDQKELRLRVTGRIWRDE